MDKCVIDSLQGYFAHIYGSDWSNLPGYGIVLVMKRNYQPKKKKRASTHGFRARLKTVGGRNLLLRRRRKGRARLSV